MSKSNGTVTKPATSKPTPGQTAEKARRAELRARIAEIDASVENSKAEQEQRQREQDGYRANAFAETNELMYDRIIEKIEWHLDEVQQALRIHRAGKGIDLGQMTWDLLDAAALAKLLNHAARTHWE